jgi:D-arabinose 5-phosphate isomerase GutQ
MIASIEKTIEVGGHQPFEVMMRIQIGDQVMFISGVGETQELAEFAVERSFASCIMVTQNYSAIMMRSGHFNWAAAEEER